MYSSNKIKAAGATLMVGFLLAIAFASTAAAGNGKVLKAERARADATNRFYHLGIYSPTMALAAEKARADATNRFYHLGKYSPAATTRGEQARAQATNQYYRLGRYAVIETSSSFQWSDAGIGAGAMLGAILLAGGLLVALRRRSVDKASPLMTT